LGRFEALGLRDEKLVGAPIESEPGIICDVRARLAATLAVGRLYSGGSEDASGSDAGCGDWGKEQPTRMRLEAWACVMALPCYLRLLWRGGDEMVGLGPKDVESWITLMQHVSRNPERGPSLTLLAARWSKDGQGRGRE
jgi:hypothetical protein